jgi:phosphate:Na+ symporter
VLFVVGLVAFRGGARTRVKDLGRVSIGLGLILLALHILLDTLAPAENAPTARTLLNVVTNDPVLCIAIAAGLTWAAHSSVTTVLLIISLAYSHFVEPPAALALVLGANMGSAINPFIEAGRRGDPASYRVPLGNLLNRLFGVMVIAPFLQPVAMAFTSLQPDMAKMTGRVPRSVQRGFGARVHWIASTVRLAVAEAAPGANPRSGFLGSALSR